MHHANTIHQFHSARLAHLTEVLMKSAGEQLTKACDLTFAQFKLLYVLQEQGKLSQQEVAGCLQLTPAAISRLTEALESKKYLQRAENPKNRRQNSLVISPEGQRQLTQGMALLHKMEAELYQSLSPAELKQFLEILTRLTAVAEGRGVSYNTHQ